MYTVEVDVDGVINNVLEMSIRRERISGNKLFDSISCEQITDYHLKSLSGDARKAIFKAFCSAEILRGFLPYPETDTFLKSLRTLSQDFGVSVIFNTLVVEGKSSARIEMLERLFSMYEFGALPNIGVQVNEGKKSYITTADFVFEDCYCNLLDRGEAEGVTRMLVSRPYNVWEQEDAKAKGVHVLSNVLAGVDLIKKAIEKTAIYA